MSYMCHVCYLSSIECAYQHRIFQGTLPTSRRYNLFRPVVSTGRAPSCGCFAQICITPCANTLFNSFLINQSRKLCFAVYLLYVATRITRRKLDKTNESCIPRRERSDGAVIQKERPNFQSVERFKLDIKPQELTVFF